MKIFNKTAYLVIFFAALSLALAGCKEDAPASKKSEEKSESVAQGNIVEPQASGSEAFAMLPDVVAKVNGVDLLKSDLEKIYSMISAQAKMSGDAKSDKEVIDVALGELLNMEVLKQESARRNIVPSPEDIESEMKTIRANFPDDAAFEATLKSKGLTIEGVKKSVTEQLSVQKMLEKEVQSKISISDKEISKFYSENPDYFKTKDSVRASHILIKTEENDDEKKLAEARKKIDAILVELKKGGDFAKIAQEKSEGPSAPNGGDLGYFGKGQMVPSFEEAVYKLKVGEISDVVKTQFGFHVIKLVDIKEAGTTPLSEVEDSIKMFLSRQKGEEVFKEFVAKLRSSASIEKKI
ncbi:MAG: peptidylprolyl isomerase [bacterium]|nr:peptidylprolyl isomerase [bacterium]